MTPNCRRETISADELARHLPPSGLYQVMFKLDRPLAQRVGALGECLFKAGFWVYTGSARRALGARIARHAARDKRPHWHIDYLLPPGRVVAARVVSISAASECGLHEALAERFVEGPAGFGSSDCACRSHLVYVGKKALLTEGFFEILRPESR